MNRTGKGDVACSFAREGHKVHFRVLTPYRVMAESPEGRQAGDLHRRQPRGEGRRLSSRAATADRHRVR
jgi:hypothetical protein